MNRYIRSASGALVLVCGLTMTKANGQAPTIDSGLPPLPGSTSSLLGQAPGAGGSSRGNSPGTGGILGGRAGVNTPHGIPTSISNPGSAAGPTDAQVGISGPKPAPVTAATAPIFGTLDIPIGPDDEGPADGLTLDAAIGMTLDRNLDLKAKFLEIPQAEADILQASLRANPVLYFDGQLLQYQGSKFSRAVPGGPSQYDLNISYPLDLSRKRQARTVVASRAKKVLDAQYRDAVRQKIDDLYGAYVDALAARQAVRYVQESVRVLESLQSRTQQLYDRKQISLTDVNRVKIQLRTAKLGLLDAQSSLRKSKLGLAMVLTIPPVQAQAMDLKGSINVEAPTLPSTDELTRIALESRPDLLSFRLGVSRAASDVDLAKANRFSDVYVLVQPFTYQDNTPYGLRSQYSWALGATVPLPIYNRNQGAILRARENVLQSNIQLADLERTVILDVQKAVEEYEITRREVEEVRSEILPTARQIRDDAYRLYTAGSTGITDYINAQLDFNLVVKQYLDTAIRHRRSMLALNTAVGRRLVP